MIDIEKFLISLRNHKDADGLRHPIYLADSLQEEIKIIQDAIQHSRREWVGLTEAEKVNTAISCGCADVAWMDFADAIEAKLREKNA